MMITLNLKPELEAGLLARARATGTTPEDNVQHWLDARTSPRQEAVRRMLQFGDKYDLSFGEPVTLKVLHEGHRC